MRRTAGIFLGFVSVCLIGDISLAAAQVVNQDRSPSVQARVLKPDRLREPAKILVVPFTPGPGVPANDELDRVALLIVKGIADTLKNANSQLVFLTAADAQEADIVVRGRIAVMERRAPSWWRLGAKRERLILSVEGSVLGVDPEELIARFSYRDSDKGKTVYWDTLGYRCGEKIGVFLTQ